MFRHLLLPAFVAICTKSFLAATDGFVLSDTTLLPFFIASLAACNWNVWINYNFLEVDQLH